MAKVLRLLPCNWPNCCCYEHYAFFDVMIDEVLANRMPKEALRGNMPIIYCMLRCMATNCRSRNIRVQAAAELLHPIWKEEKRSWDHE